MVQTHVLPVHAEVEGGIFQNQFRELLKDAINMGIEVVPLKEIKQKLDIKSLPQAQIQNGITPRSPFGLCCIDSLKLLLSAFLK